MFEVVHLSGVLLSLEKRHLTKLNRKHIVKVAKKTIEHINNTFNGDFSRIHLDSRGYEFQEAKTDEMQEIIEYAREKYLDQIKVVERTYVANVWYGLNGEITQKQILEKFEAVTPTRRCSYNMEGIFHQVKPEVIVDKILSLSNESRLEFMWFLMGRYYLKGCGVRGDIRNEMKEDKTSLVKISAMLKARAKRKRLIEKETIMMISAK